MDLILSERAVVDVFGSVRGDQRVEYTADLFWCCTVCPFLFIKPRIILHTQYMLCAGYFHCYLFPNLVISDNILLCSHGTMRLDHEGADIMHQNALGFVGRDICHHKRAPDCLVNLKLSILQVKRHTHVFKVTYSTANLLMYLRGNTSGIINGLRSILIIAVYKHTLYLHITCMVFSV